MAAPKVLKAIVFTSLLLAWLAPTSAQPNRPQFVHGVWNPEDMVALFGSSWVIVSAMRSPEHPGSILAVDISKPNFAITVYPGRGSIANGPIRSRSRRTGWTAAS